MDRNRICISTRYSCTSPQWLSPWPCSTSEQPPTVGTEGDWSSFQGSPSDVAVDSASGRDRDAPMGNRAGVWDDSLLEWFRKFLCSEFLTSRYFLILWVSRAGNEIWMLRAAMVSTALSLLGSFVLWTKPSWCGYTQELHQILCQLQAKLDVSYSNSAVKPWIMLFLCPVISPFPAAKTGSKERQWRGPRS